MNGKRTLVAVAGLIAAGWISLALMAQQPTTPPPAAPTPAPQAQRPLARNPIPDTFTQPAGLAQGRQQARASRHHEDILRHPGQALQLLLPCGHRRPVPGGLRLGREGKQEEGPRVAEKAGEYSSVGTGITLIGC
jgi:hypothetical protein